MVEKGNTLETAQTLYIDEFRTSAENHFKSHIRDPASTAQLSMKSFKRQGHWWKCEVITGQP